MPADSAMDRSPVLKIYLAATAAVIIADQLTKLWIQGRMVAGQVIPVLDGLIQRAGVAEGGVGENWYETK